MSKPKKPVRTKEQIISDLRANKDFQSKLQFTKEKFWPALCKASTSIDDANLLLNGFNTTLMQEFLGLMKEKTIKDLKLEERLDGTNERKGEFMELLSIFDGMTVFEVKDHIEGMRNEIALFLTEEQKKRQLIELKPQWLDEYLNEMK